MYDTIYEAIVHIVNQTGPYTQLAMKLGENNKKSFFSLYLYTLALRLAQVAPILEINGHEYKM